MATVTATPFEGLSELLGAFERCTGLSVDFGYEDGASAYRVRVSHRTSSRAIYIVAEELRGRPSDGWPLILRALTECQRQLELRNPSPQGIPYWLEKSPGVPLPPVPDVRVAADLLDEHGFAEVAEYLRDQARMVDDPHDAAGIRFDRAMASQLEEEDRRWNRVMGLDRD